MRFKRTPRGVLKVLLASAAASALATSTAHAATYYVSTSGNDSNTGTSDTSPWQSIGKLNAQTFSPGDVVRFRRGDSWNAKLSVSSSGTSSAPITFTSYGNGNPKPSLSYNCGQGFTVSGDYVVIDDLLFQDQGSPCYADSSVDFVNAYYGGGAVYFTSTADHNILRNSEITNVGIGVRVGGPYNQVVHNYIHDLHFHTPQDRGSSGSYGAFGVTVNNSHNTIAYNRFIRDRASRNFGTGAADDWDGGAIEVEGHYYDTFDTITDLSIDHNYSKDNEGFAEVDISTPSDIRVSYNVSDDYQQFWGFANDSNLDLSNGGFVFDHNTVIRRDRPYTWNVFTYFAKPAPASFNYYSFTNNIFAIRSTQKIDADRDQPHNHNLYYRSDGTTSASDILGSGSLGTGDVVADPQLVSYAPSDPHIGSSSPAKDAGTASSPAFAADFDGRPSSVGSAPDIGALEYQGSVNANLLLDPGFENQTSGELSEPWRKDEGDGFVGIDYHQPGYPRSGSNDAYIAGVTGAWTSVAQPTIDVAPNTSYTLTCYERDSGNITGYIGVYYTSSKTAGVKTEQSFGGSSSYTARSVTFNSGSHTQVTPYIGYPGSTGTYMVFDDCSLTT